MTCLTLSRTEFHELLGDLHELMDHNNSIRILQTIPIFSKAEYYIRATVRKQTVSISMSFEASTL